MYDPMEVTISEAEIREELRLLLQSKSFQQSQRLVRFLKFTVERALTDELGELKEYTIGVEVYDRGPSFCPSLDSIVRGEARRLRGKLKEYYEGEGKRRPVTIYYRLGSYVPLFRRTDPFATRSALTPRQIHSFTGEPSPVVAVVPFRDLSNSPATLALANGITDELIHHLTTTGGYRVIAASTVAHLLFRGIDTQVLGTRLGSQVVFEGSVKHGEKEIRITSSLVDADGFQLSSHRFDSSDCGAKSLFALQETIASDLVSRLSLLLRRHTDRECSRTFPNICAIDDRSSADMSQC